MAIPDVYYFTASDATHAQVAHPITSRIYGPITFPFYLQVKDDVMSAPLTGPTDFLLFERVTQGGRGSDVQHFFDTNFPPGSSTRNLLSALEAAGAKCGSRTDNNGVTRHGCTKYLPAPSGEGLLGSIEWNVFIEESAIDRIAHIIITRRQAGS